MKKDYHVFLQHILTSIEKIEEYTMEISKAEFEASSKTQDAVIRNFEIMGEAVKNIPQSFKTKHPEIPWQRIAGLRDVLIHMYFGVELNLQDVAILAIFHDYGEAKSGDTGAQSIAMYNICKLHNLERDGLKSTVTDWKMANVIMKLYDDYRKYGTPEALVVHIADNLEGFEKALENFHNKPWVLEDALRIFQENIQIYNRRKMFGEQLGKVADFLVETVLIPGMQALADTFRIGANMRELAEKAKNLSPQE